MIYFVSVINAGQEKNLKKNRLHLRNQKTDIMNKTKELSGWGKLWNFAKPVAIIVIAGIGYFASNQDVPKYSFLAIGVLSIVLRGRSIGAGFVALLYAVRKKK